MEAFGRYLLQRPAPVAGLIVLAILLLPLSVWLDLRNLSDQNLTTQASILNRVITVVRSYYAKNVVDRVVTANGQAHPLSAYLDVPGGIPIPATLSIELGEEIGLAQDGVAYRFVSPYPFRSRAPYRLTPFEQTAFRQFTATGGRSGQMIETVGNLWDRNVTLAVPVVMGSACVACHNSHPDSPKQDWRIGDVRGLQTISIHQPVALDIWSFKWLLGYLILAGTIGLLFAVVQFRLARAYQGMNAELEQNNTFLADISLKISRYLSPEIYRSIFSGEKDASISTERKKLTVFFSDIKDFTATTERMQPEELTAVLNEYFTEMSNIAERHGATIDKFIGDAIVAFFGDPITKGAAEDARSCVQMAIDMQKRLAELNLMWRMRGIEHPFRARMGINTGYCNVGNFGSNVRMDYTIIGAEANLAARLEGIAKPGGIVMSYETWAHARTIVDAVPLAPTHFKGIAREVIPYEAVLPDWDDVQVNILHETAPGLEVFMNLDALDDDARLAARAMLRRALAAVGGEDLADATAPVAAQPGSAEPPPAPRVLPPRR
mgnify:CR=1 FL=1